MLQQVEETFQSRAFQVEVVCMRRPFALNACPAASYACVESHVETDAENDNVHCEELVCLYEPDMD